MEASHISTGRRGEKAVENHLKRKGYIFCEANYRKKWGEIDLIFSKGNSIHFIEVKTVTRETVRKDVSYGTWLPEENVDRRKLLKLFRTIESWLLEHNYEGEWQLDVASVWLDARTHRGKIKVIENIVEDL